MNVAGERGLGGDVLRRWLSFNMRECYGGVGVCDSGWCRGVIPHSRVSVAIYQGQ